MIDPDWMLPYEQRRADFITQTCCHLAQQFFAADFRCVLIAGNALYTAETVELYRQALTPFSYLYHVTLDADLATLVERVRQRGDLTAHPPNWLAEWLAHIRGHYADWTHIIDTTNLSASAILMPVAPIATLAGAWLVRRLRASIFYGFTYSMMFLVAIKLIYDGLIDIFG